jgi:hypothetical protein
MTEELPVAPAGNRRERAFDGSLFRQPRYPRTTRGPEALRPRLAAGLPLLSRQSIRLSDRFHNTAKNDIFDFAP